MYHANWSSDILSSLDGDFNVAVNFDIDIESNAGTDKDSSLYTGIEIEQSTEWYLPAWYLESLPPPEQCFSIPKKPGPVRQSAEESLLSRYKEVH